MKQITKQVTVEKTMYIAEDGTEFESKLSCELYEKGFWEKSLAFYDFRFEKSNLDKCSYVCILNDKDYNTMKKLCDFEGVSEKGIENKPGIYMYEERRDAWVNISEAVDKITAKEKENDQT